MKRNASQVTSGFTPSSAIVLLMGILLAVAPEKALSMNDQQFDEGLVLVVGGLPVKALASEEAATIARVDGLARRLGGTLARYVVVTEVTSELAGVEEYWVVKPQLVRLEEGLWTAGAFPQAIKGLVGGLAEPDSFGDRRRSTRDLLEEIEATLVSLAGT